MRALVMIPPVRLNKIFNVSGFDQAFPACSRKEMVLIFLTREKCSQRRLYFIMYGCL